MDNPYIKIVEVIKNQKFTPSFLIGEVISLDPLKIKISGNEFDRDDLLIDSRLVYITTYGSEEYYLNIGDRVAILLSHDMQELILLCKVV